MWLLSDLNMEEDRKGQEDRQNECLSVFINPICCTTHNVLVLFLVVGVMLPGQVCPHGKTIPN